MDPTLLLLLAWLAASISCAGCVFSWLIARRGGDAGLKGDVNELALLVERLSRESRRERMRRVRQGEKATDAGAEYPIPPGGEALAGGETVAPVFDKLELRRRMARSRGIG